MTTELTRADWEKKLPRTPEEWEKLPKVIHHVTHAIRNDEWMFIVTWGKPRTGKSNFCFGLGYYVYKDWDEVLGCVVFQLAGLLHNFKAGLPRRIWTDNMRHNRVPYTIWDDGGAHGNKAKTQHEQAYDLLKGAWDTYGTQAGVVAVNMNRPDELTKQLTDKYTHEIYIPTRGTAKYDVTNWQPDYIGWTTRQKKEWLQTFDFDPVPEDVYKEYDQMRQALCDETYTLIQDAIANTNTEKTIKRLTPADIELLETINLKGAISRQWFYLPENTKLQEQLSGNKARGLIVATRKAGTQSYYYELTDFGINILDTIAELNSSPQELKYKLRNAKLRTDAGS